MFSDIVFRLRSLLRRDGVEDELAKCREVRSAAGSSGGAKKNLY
jgi:hypothetical protein